MIDVSVGRTVVWDTVRRPVVEGCAQVSDRFAAWIEDGATLPRVVAADLAVGDAGGVSTGHGRRAGSRDDEDSRNSRRLAVASAPFALCASFHHLAGGDVDVAPYLYRARTSRVAADLPAKKVQRGYQGV
ncbi:hypothetical protein [Streptomyces sp. NRRL F-5053]|uniref:hypothetical protein n=1 Tax=Streptomyces sp. NRRL F-5053 TaxID=1463854 RepID=UPI001331B723|nr:hypothetical protein [Streptomyces sp. NRRL F-5053]